MILDPVKKETVHKYHDGYMTHPMFESAIKPFTINSINTELTKSNVSVISLVMFYDNMKIIMYKVNRDLIYTIIDNYICLDYMGMLQYK